MVNCACVKLLTSSFLAILMVSVRLTITYKLAGSGTSARQRVLIGSKRVRLYSKHSGGYVKVTDTSINARPTNLKADPNTILTLEFYGLHGCTLKNRNNFYICFNRRNSAVVVKKKLTVECFFNETMLGNGHKTYQSCFNNTWYLAFYNRKKKKKGFLRGLPKLGRKTKQGQTSIEFSTIDTAK